VCVSVLIYRMRSMMVNEREEVQYPITNEWSWNNEL